MSRRRSMGWRIGRGRWFGPGASCPQRLAAEHAILNFLKFLPAPISSITTPRYARFPTRGLNAGDALESRHDGRDVDGLRHQVGDLDTSGNASGITARIDGYLRHREFGWSAVAGRRSLPGQPDGAGARPLGRRGFGYLHSGRLQSPGVDSAWIGHDRADSATPRGVRRSETQKAFSESMAETVQDATVSRSAVSCLHGRAKGSEPETTGSFGLWGREPIQHLHPRSKTSPPRAAISRLCWPRYGLELSPQP